MQATVRDWLGGNRSVYNPARVFRAAVEKLLEPTALAAGFARTTIPDMPDASAFGSVGWRHQLAVRLQRAAISVVSFLKLD